MNRLLSSTLMALLALAGCLAAQDERGSGIRPDLTLFDFESGTFAGWQMEGGQAFGPRPVEVETEMWSRLSSGRLSYKFAGWQGRFLVATNMWASEKHHWSRPYKQAAGRLISQEFEISRPYLRFLMGGMLNPGVGVRLKCGGQTVRTAYGNNSFDLRMRAWDVKELMGRKARLEIFAETRNQERSILRVDYFHLSDSAPLPEALTIPVHPKDNKVFRAGLFEHVLDSTGAGSEAFGAAAVVKGHDGHYHLYAEEHKAPGTTVNGWYKERNDTIFHASAPSPEGPWSPLKPVLRRDPAFGEAYLWKPSVVFHDGTYYMFYLASGEPRDEHRFDRGATGVHLATSRDGVAWTRHGNRALFTEEPEIGGISVVRAGNKWAMFYSAFTALSPNHKYPPMSLFYRLSDDLVHWSRWNVAMHATRETAGLGMGQITVFSHGGEWYLIGRRDHSQFGRTRFLFSEIWRSRDPFCWDFEKGSLGLIDAWGSHAVIEGLDASLKILHMHDDSRGAWIAPLAFIQP